MGHSQVRRRRRAHRALRKNAPAHPLRRGSYNKESSQNHFREQNHAFALRDSICTRRALTVLRMTAKQAGERAIWMPTIHPSRKDFCVSKKIFAKSPHDFFVLAQKSVNSNSLSRAGFPCASSQRSKFRKPLRSSRLCPNARCSSSQKTRCAIFAGALFLKILPRAKPRFCC